MIFNPVIPVSIITTISTGLILLALWLEWKKNSRFFVLRGIAQIIMIASLAAIILRPAVNKEYHAEEIILLTPEFSFHQADSLVKLYPSARLKRTRDADRYNNAEVFQSPHEITHSIQDIRFVLGNGLPLSSFDRETEINYTYLPGPVKEGVTEIYFDETPVVNHKVEAKGSIHGLMNSWLILKSPGGREDSVHIKRNSFDLKFIPKQAGNFIYQLEVKDTSGRVVETQPLPVQVLPEKNLRILILQDYPTAEIRYLKNFLSERNHHITLRYQLSRNVYRHEFANSEQRNIGKLNAGVLNDFDLLIIVSDAVQSLSSMEKRQLEESIHRGLGIVILFNDSPDQSKVLKDFSNITFASTKSDTTHADLSGDGKITLKTLGKSIVDQQPLQPILRNTAGVIFSGFTSSGRGHIGYQLITETYRFIAEGKTEVYSELWSDLIEKTSRTDQHPFRIKILSPDPIYANEPVDVEVTSVIEVPELMADKNKIALTEDVLIDNRWLGKVWFHETGWHSLTILQDSTKKSVYVHENENWKSIRVAKQHSENKIRQVATAEKKNNSISVREEQISPLIFFMAFLIAAGFLWLAPKL